MRRVITTALALVLAATLAGCGSTPQADQNVIELTIDQLTICLTSAGSSLQWASTTEPDGCKFGVNRSTQESDSYYDGPGGNVGIRNLSIQPDIFGVGFANIVIAPENAEVTADSAELVQRTTLETGVGTISLHLLDPRRCDQRCAVITESTFGTSTSSVPVSQGPNQLTEIGPYSN